MKQGYYLGLDLGTGSLGWAVTNNQYEIERAHGKALWGVRLFETAKTAEERRMFRTARRRLARRNRRIQLLQELFSEAICEVDPGFYQRLKESRYTPEDKKDEMGNCPELPYALFTDADYTDKDYHKEYPTIYHLRKTVMESKRPMDVRLVYLALHHIMKHRGHFLFPGTNLDSIQDFSSIFNNFTQVVRENELDFEIEIGEEEIRQTEVILKDKGKGRTGKKLALIQKLTARSKCEKALLNLIVGGTVKLSDIFGDEELDHNEHSKISFSDAGYEDYAAEIEDNLLERYPVIAYAKGIYDWALLADILGENKSISEAKIAVYEKHKKDLAYLKHLVKTYLSKDDYRETFVSCKGGLNNYCAYIGKGEEGTCTREEFYVYLKKYVLEKVGENAESLYLKEELDKNSFLPKQVTKDNGVLPNQLHLYELKRILESAGSYFPFLKENAEKIVQLFSFRIPYYVGPLNVIKEKEEAKFGWAVRKTEEVVYPWNFEDVIDVEQSAETFIRRMTNKCTYLSGEDVLPKESLLYSKFMVLNELNNLKIDGESISVELKQKIYHDLFQRYRKVTRKRLSEYLRKEGIVGKNADITGVDGDFKSSLKAYHDLKEKLTGCNLSQDEKEKIILNITLFGDDKKLLKKRLSKMMPDLTEGQLKGLLSMQYSGWGRLSKTFLDEIAAPDPETGELLTVIGALWEKNDNLMQLLSEKYLFHNVVEERNEGKIPARFSYETVEELYVSPAVKRQIWQTLVVVREICKVMGEPPKRVFIEMAREKQESKRTVSRKQVLQELYSHCKGEERDWKNELDVTDDHKLRSDRLFLYYTQKGRCMYSGEPIELSDLWDNNKYDIDHIYPQSKVMDDSLDNRVLVKRVYNAEKTDHYPLRQDIREKQKPFWKSLTDGKFISKEKYQRLIRVTEFEPEELAGFIQRQLVETRQSTKAVADILKRILPESDIVYVKANSVSQFRQDFDMIKVRELNDYHHAKDAYLNIVVGNCYYTKFTMNASWYVKQNPGRTYNLKRMFTSDWNIERNGEAAWKAGANGTIVTVRKMMDKNNILFTRRSYEAKGGLFDQQLMKKGKGQIPIKGSNPRLESIEKYGGYNKAAGAYFMLVESLGKKNEKIRTIEFVPIYLKKQLEESEEARIRYCEEQLGLRSPEILISRIKIDTLFKVDGFYMHLSGRTEKRLVFKGANQLLLDKNQERVLKKIIKYAERSKMARGLKLTSYDQIESVQLVELYDEFINKIRCTIYGARLSAQEKTLVEKRERFLELSMEEQCLVLCEILHLFQCQSGAANLKLLGGPGKAGILVLNNNITACKQISILYQSPTGIYEQEIDLLKV